MLRPWRWETTPGLLLRRCTLFAPATRPTKNSVPYWLACCRPNPATHKQALPQKLVTRRGRPQLVSSRLASLSHAICMPDCTKRRRFRPRHFRQGEGKQPIAINTRLATCESQVALFNVVGLLFQSSPQHTWCLCFRGTRGRVSERRLITQMLVESYSVEFCCPSGVYCMRPAPVRSDNVWLFGMCNGDRWEPSGNARGLAAHAKAAELGQKLSIGLEAAYQVQ